MSHTSEEKRNADIELGYGTIEAIGPLLKIAEGNAINPVHFWAGVISAITGFSVSTVGSHATKILLDASASCGQQVHQESLHG